MNPKKGESLFMVSNLNKEDDCNGTLVKVPILRNKFDLILGCDGSAVRGLLACQSNVCRAWVPRAES